MGGGRGQDGCERRIEVFVKIKKKKNWGEEGRVGGGGGGVSVDVTRELKFCENKKIKKIWGGGGFGVRSGGLWGGGSGWT